MFKVDDKVYVKGDKSRIEYTICEINYCSCKAILKPYFNVYNMEDLEPVDTSIVTINTLKPDSIKIDNLTCKIDVFEDLIVCGKNYTKELQILRKRFYRDKWKRRVKYGRR